jgi:hypothetical protein
MLATRQRQSRHFLTASLSEPDLRYALTDAARCLGSGSLRLAVRKRGLMPMSSDWRLGCGSLPSIPTIPRVSRSDGEGPP